LVASAMDVMATMVWLVWFLFVFYRTRQTLRMLPFLSTRYRQLSFRFFSFLNFSSILFGFFVLAFSIYAGVRAGIRKMIPFFFFLSLSLFFS